MEIDFFAETLFLILSYITVIRFVKIKLRRRWTQKVKEVKLTLNKLDPNHPSPIKGAHQLEWTQ